MEGMDFKAIYAEALKADVSKHFVLRLMQNVMIAKLEKENDFAVCIILGEKMRSVRDEISKHSNVELSDKNFPVCGMNILGVPAAWQSIADFGVKMHFESGHVEIID